MSSDAQEVDPASHGRLSAVNSAVSSYRHPNPVQSITSKKPRSLSMSTPQDLPAAQSEGKMSANSDSMNTSIQASKNNAELTSADEDRSDNASAKSNAGSRKRSSSQGVRSVRFALPSPLDARKSSRTTPPNKSDNQLVCKLIYNAFDFLKVYNCLNTGANQEQVGQVFVSIA